MLKRHVYDCVVPKLFADIYKCVENLFILFPWEIV